MLYDQLIRENQPNRKPVKMVKTENALVFLRFISCGLQITIGQIFFMSKQSNMCFFFNSMSSHPNTSVTPPPTPLPKPQFTVAAIHGQSEESLHSHVSKCGLRLALYTGEIS